MSCPLPADRRTEGSRNTHAVLPSSTNEVVSPEGKGTDDSRKTVRLLTHAGREVVGPGNFRTFGLHG
jgi:hypothetical protein